MEDSQTRSMALPQNRRRYLFPSSSSSLPHHTPFPSPPPTETPLSPSSSSSSSSHYFHNPSATLSWVNTHEPFFLDSISAMEEMNKLSNDASATERAQALKAQVSEETYRKIKSSMAVSAVLNPSSSTPPDSMSQTSERYPLGNFESSFDAPAAEEKPASPPQTPPHTQVRYMSHHERHQQQIKETIKLETARLQLQKGTNNTQTIPDKPERLMVKVEPEDGPTPAAASKSPVVRRLSGRLTQSESPEQQQPKVINREEIQPRIIRLKFKEQTSIISLEPLTNTSNSINSINSMNNKQPNQLPVKRGRGRPRKIDPLTGEPLAKKPKTVMLDENGEPIPKKRKIKKTPTNQGVNLRLEGGEAATDKNSALVDGIKPSIGEGQPSLDAIKKRKRRPSTDELTSYPHIHRKQKIVTTSEEKHPRPGQYEHGQGLTNLGATCYVNVVVQILAHTKILKDYFLACDFARSSKKIQSPVKVKSQCARRTREADRTMKELVPKLKGKLGEEFGSLLRSLVFDEDDERKVGKKTEACIGSNQFWAALCANLQKDGETDMDPTRLQDAHEFLILFLEAIASESNPVVDGYSLPEIIDNCFAGVHCTTFTCNNCNDVTTREDKCLELELPVSRTIPVHGQLEESTLENHLKSYVLPEEKEWADDSFTSSDGTKRKGCPSCGIDKGRSMHNTVKPRGNYVCIELKRFLWEDGENKKVRGHVGFPMRDLDLSVCGEKGETTTTTTTAITALTPPETASNAEEQQQQPITIVPPPMLYDLYGVIVHQGEKSTTGHYYAFAKEGDQWYRFNDKTVTAVAEEEVAKEEAYILMYEKKNAA